MIDRKIVIPRVPADEREQLKYGIDSPPVWIWTLLGAIILLEVLIILIF